MLVHWVASSLVLVAGACSFAGGADRLILRNLDIINDRTVTAVDEDGVVLDSALPSGRTRLTWDEIERGKITLDQPKFDVLLAELGLPLYRIRQRLKIGDVRGAGEVADKLYPRFHERRSQTALLVAQAVMGSRLAEGRLEEAVEPALRSFELLRSKAASVSELPGSRQPKFDVQTGLWSELAPMWLDAEAAKKALPEVETAIRWMAQPRPVGAYLYYATLAIEAGQESEAQRVLAFLEGGGSTALVDLVKAQQELASGGGPACERLRQSRDSLPEACQPAASMVLGRVDANSSDEDRIRDGLLELLSIPAAHGDELRELSAAALYYAAEGLDKLKDAAGAAVVRSELSGRFGRTRFATAGRGAPGKNN